MLYDGSMTKTQEINASEIINAIEAAGITEPITVEMTGGGCHTIYVGDFTNSVGVDKFAPGAEYAFAKVAIGPFDGELTGSLGDLAVGPDGLDETATYPSDLAGIVSAVRDTLAQ